MMETLSAYQYLWNWLYFSTSLAVGLLLLGQWGVSRSDISYFQAWPFKRPIQSPALFSLPTVVTLKTLNSKWFRYKRRRAVSPVHEQEINFILLRFLDLPVAALLTHQLLSPKMDKTSWGSDCENLSELGTQERRYLWSLVGPCFFQLSSVNH